MIVDCAPESTKALMGCLERGGKKGVGQSVRRRIPRRAKGAGCVDYVDPSIRAYKMTVIPSILYIFSLLHFVASCPSTPTR